MLSWRQTSAGLHRSVQTASTAWTLSCALCGGVGFLFLRSVFSLAVGVLVEIIDKFLFLVLLIADTEFEFSFFGAEHDGLAVHASHHVERRLRFAAQRQFQQVFLNAGLDGFAQFGLDLEEAVGGAQAVDALVGPLMVVMFDPEFDPLARRLEAVELGADQEVLPDGGPEPFDLAQRHRVLRPGLEMGHMILFKLRFKAAGAAPTGVLPAVIRQHLLGRLILADRHPVDFDHRVRRGTAEQVGPHDEPRVIVHEGDQIRVTTTEPEGEDVRLPHLVGRSPLEETGPGEIALFRWRGLRH